eukprot:6198084-Pleurochrysis_carterae.AAC.1
MESTRVHTRVNTHACASAYIHARTRTRPHADSHEHTPTRIRVPSQRRTYADQGRRAGGRVALSTTERSTPNESARPARRLLAYLPPDCVDIILTALISSWLR